VLWQQTLGCDILTQPHFRIKHDATA
jgi:hypothetical protein